MPNPREVDEIVWYIRSALRGLSYQQDVRDDLNIALELLGAKPEEDE